MRVGLRQVSGGVVIDVYVKPNSKQFQLKVEGDELVLLCRESPVKGRVNKELIKELSRIFKSRVEIVAGFTSKQKKVLVKGINVGEAKSILSKYASKWARCQESRLWIKRRRRWLPAKEKLAFSA